MAMMWYLSVLFFVGLLVSVSCNALKEIEHNAANLKAEKDIERRDVSSGKLYMSIHEWLLPILFLGSCITVLYIMAFTSGYGGAQTHASAHEIELKVNGVRRKGNLPNLVGYDFQKNKGDLWKISVPSFGFGDSCIKKNEVENIALVEDSNDGWHIDSIVTFFGTSNGQFELASMDINTFRWVDGDQGTSARRFDMTLQMF